MKALITGAGGFMGLHLAEFLKGKDAEILSTYYEPIWVPALLKKYGEALELDVRDKEKVKQVIADFKPDRIYHLAAQSYPTVSWEKPNYTIDSNVNGTINVFEAVKGLKLNAKILVAGSSAEYGFVIEDEVPISEDHQLRPLHPYGVSKVAQEQLAYQYHKNFGMDAITIRIFNTTGPGKVNDVCSDFTKRAALIMAGKENSFKVGNLNTRRTITDVRDGIRAFYLATEKGQAGEVYNMSGNRTYKIQEILDTILKITGINPEIIVDKALLRPTDEPIIYGDSSKLHNDTGWQQEIQLEKTLKDMINFWTEKIKRGENETSHNQFNK